MLTTFDRVTYRVPAGLAAMLGAGILAGLAPAASAAGAWLLAGLVISAALSVACGLSIVDSRQSLPYAVGVIGRIVGAAAIAETFGHYLLPDQPLVAAIGLIVVATAVSSLGLGQSPTLTVAGISVVFAVFAVFVAACFAIEPAGQAVAPPAGSPGLADLAGLPVATLLMFFAFLGFDRVPGRQRWFTIGIALVIYLAVAGAALHQLGGTRLALSATPLRDALAAADASGIDTMLTVGAALATVLALLGVLSDLRAGPRGVVLTPVAGLAAAIGTVLLTVPVAMGVAAGLMLGHYALAVATSRRGSGRTQPR